MKAKLNQTIAGQALTALTGLTDRRHRQLAKDGFFPEPVRGEYQLTATIKGVVTYYRDSRQRTTKGMAEERLREPRERADSLALANARERGELLDKADFIQSLEEHVALCKVKVLESNRSPADQDDLLNFFADLLGCAKRPPRRARANALGGQGNSEH
jgi:hypothetical protein